MPATLSPTKMQQMRELLRAVAWITSRAERTDRSAIMLAYASMGMLYPGSAPQKTEQLALCATLLDEHPWMKDRAFKFLGRLAGSSWPYVIRRWGELVETLEEETGFIPGSYAPRTFSLLREINLRRCDKPYCGHAMEDHAAEFSNNRRTFAHTGRCTVEGCPCRRFHAPRQ